MQPNEATPQTTSLPLPDTLGPGSTPERAADYEPALDGATRDEVIEILNPLTQQFVAKIGVTRTAMMPVRIGKNPSGQNFTESDMGRVGISGFRNPDKGGGVVHIENRVPIPPGTTIKQPGDVAQVIVRQLISTVLSVRGEKHKLADPVARRQVEQEIIISRRPMSELFGGGGPMTVDEQMRAAIEKANDQATEPEFPQLNQEMTPAQQRAAHAREVKAEKNGSAT